MSFYTISLVRIKAHRGKCIKICIQSCTPFFNSQVILPIFTYDFVHSNLRTSFLVTDN